MGLILGMLLGAAVGWGQNAPAPQPDLSWCDAHPEQCEPPEPPDPPERLAFYYPWWDGYDTARQQPRRKRSECSTTWLAQNDPDAVFHPDFSANGGFEYAQDYFCRIVFVC